jgi:hypothetical protein
MAKDLSHPFTLAFAHNLLARVHQLRRDWQAALVASDELVTVASEMGFSLFTALGQAHRGAALAGLGEREGIASMNAALDLHRGLGMVMPLHEWLPTLADSHGVFGEYAKGLSVLAEAFALVAKAGDSWYEGEMWRIKGELLHLAKAGGDESSACFGRALDIARDRQAKSFELRAALSLARFWLAQDERIEARTLLSETYGWFTEGFDTPDLKDAKALLDELSPQ